MGGALLATLQPSTRGANAAAAVLVALGVAAVGFAVPMLTSGHAAVGILLIVAAAVVLVLAAAVRAGAAALRVVVTPDSVVIAHRRIARTDVSTLTLEHIGRARRIVLRGHDGTILYAMADWFSPAQLDELSGALGLTVEDRREAVNDEGEAGAAEPPPVDRSGLP